MQCSDDTSCVNSTFSQGDPRHFPTYMHRVELSRSGLEVDDFVLVEVSSDVVAQCLLQVHQHQLRRTDVLDCEEILLSNEGGDTWSELPKSHQNYPRAESRSDSAVGVHLRKHEGCNLFP